MTLESEIVGWIGNICFIIGCWLLARKERKGFYLNTVGNFMYGVQSVIMTNMSLWVLSLLLGAINIYGIIKWKSKGE